MSTTIYADKPHDIALPHWTDLTRSEHDEHREFCAAGCSACDGHRAWGTCSRCGEWPKESNDDGLSLCCGSTVIVDQSPAEDNYAALRGAA